MTQGDDGDSLVLKYDCLQRRRKSIRCDWRWKRGSFFYVSREIFEFRFSPAKNGNLFLTEPTR